LAKRKTNTSGLLITVIFHLTVIVVLLAQQLDLQKPREEVFVMDFTNWEEMERQHQELLEEIEELKKQEEILKKLDRKLEDKYANITSNTQAVKNLAVDASGQLKDDRGTNADQLYKDAARLDASLKNGQKSAIQEDAQDETVELPGQSSSNKEGKEYSGPSVLSYTLDGRKATHLPIPAYRCYGGGEVTVIIYVNRNGTVVNAQINETVSANDKCIREYALRAARQSKFTKSDTAPERQTGEIVYQFIAQ
jgi:outer membrane biosynthesis protein TonB